jgi:hypothetical protein
MDKLLLKKAAVQSIALMVAVVTSSIALQQDKAVSISANDEIMKSNITSYELAGLVPFKDITIPVMSINSRQKLKCILWQRT